uniref:NADH dehydrogenase subunit 6 n=1 Tax=Leptaulax koreanus TaxID=2607329 RepID=A0A5C0XL73_9SCAR|nr:NADH dehydrogenase subunit 6 [Leptaulax koreanus]QEK77362.1 NADH dehydrogenase subunit 6 [Leptaulax koreanus]
MMFLSLMFILTILLMWINHPLLLGLILFIQTLNICMFLTLFSVSSWYSFILFIIMISGLLILLIYMTSLLPNFNLSIKLNKYFLLLSLLTILSFHKSHMYEFLTFYTNSWNYSMKFKILLNKYMNFPMNYLFMLLMIYLFITMISSVLITGYKKGPIRSFKN